MRSYNEQRKLGRAEHMFGHTTHHQPFQPCPSVARHGDEVVAIGALSTFRSFCQLENRFRDIRNDCNGPGDHEMVLRERTSVQTICERTEIGFCLLTLLLYIEVIEVGKAIEFAIGGRPEHDLYDMESTLSRCSQRCHEVGSGLEDGLGER